MKANLKANFLHRASVDLGRMQAVLTDDGGLDDLSLREFTRLATRLARLAETAELQHISVAADQIVTRAKRPALPKRNLDVVAKLQLWHSLIELKKEVKALQPGASVSGFGD